MTMNTRTPMALYKANLELVLRIGALLHENRRRWAQAGSAGTSEAIEHALAQTERMLTTTDWSTLSAMPGEEFWKSLRAGAGPLQGTVESAVRSQAEFAEGLKQAFAEWQQQSAEALGGNAAAPAPWAFPDLLKGAAPTTTRPAGPRPGGKPAAAAKPGAKARKAAKDRPAPAKKPAPKAASAPARKSAPGRKAKPTGR